MRMLGRDRCARQIVQGGSDRGGSLIGRQRGAETSSIVLPSRLDDGFMGF
jgi:hypothetical protein